MDYAIPLSLLSHVYLNTMSHNNNNTEIALSETQNTLHTSHALQQWLCFITYSHELCNVCMCDADKKGNPCGWYKQVTESRYWCRYSIPFFSNPLQNSSSIWAEPEPGAGDLKVFGKEAWKVTRGQLFPLSGC